MPHRTHSRPRELPEGFRGYAVVAPDGSIQLVHDLGTAVDMVQHVAKGQPWSVDANLGTGEAQVQQHEVLENPPPTWAYGAGAQRASGLPTMYLSQVLSMPLEEAHRQVAAYFNTRRYAWDPKLHRIRRSKSGDVRAYQTPQGMLEALFKVNFKLEKLDLARPLAKRLMPQAVGLNLVPAASIFSGRAGNGTKLPVNYTKTRRLPMAPIGEGSTFCVKATAECVSACLAYAGMNVQLHNTVVKLQTAQALTGSTHAFYRVLVAALDRWFYPHGKPWKKSLRFVRLNVLSDLPWERLLPDLFDRYPGRLVQGRAMAFYDYTAVPGRVTPPNYDLTFSYKGSGANKRECAEEIQRGRRVAAVFLLPGKKADRPKMPLPKVWRGPGGIELPVVDGDKDDFRPLDNTPLGAMRGQPVYVGLRYKTTVGGKAREKALKQAAAFVTSCEVIGGQMVAVETPRQTGAAT